MNSFEKELVLYGHTKTNAMIAASSPALLLPLSNGDVSKSIFSDFVYRGKGSKDDCYVRAGIWHCFYLVNQMLANNGLSAKLGALLRKPGDNYYYVDNKTSLSNHSRGQAVDIYAPKGRMQFVSSIASGVLKGSNFIHKLNSLCMIDEIGVYNDGHGQFVHFGMRFPKTGSNRVSNKQMNVITPRALSYERPLSLFTSVTR